MITTTPLAELVQNLFRPSESGVVGLVDQLLRLSKVYNLRFNFENGVCRVKRLETNSTDSIEVTIPKSVFRAILARIAALCNANYPGSVTPYGGESEVAIPHEINPSTCYVVFANTKSEQWLELRLTRQFHENGTISLKNQ